MLNWKINVIIFGFLEIFRQIQLLIYIKKKVKFFKMETIKIYM